MALRRASASLGMRRHLVACLGDAFVDVQVAGVAALPSWGEDAECQGVSLLPGGSCANAARHLASIGREELSVSFFTCIGDDEFGRWFLSKLKDEGLLAAPDESVLVCAGVPQSTCVVLSGAVDRAMVSCYSSNRLMQAEAFEEQLLRRGAPYSHLHIGGYFNCAKLHTEAPPTAAGPSPNPEPNSNPALTLTLTRTPTLTPTLTPTPTLTHAGAAGPGACSACRRCARLAGHAIRRERAVDGQ